MWLCEDMLKGKTAHFRVPSQKRACLSLLLRGLTTRGERVGIFRKVNHLLPKLEAIRVEKGSTAVRKRSFFKTTFNRVCIVAQGHHITLKVFLVEQFGTKNTLV